MSVQNLVGIDCFENVQYFVNHLRKLDQTNALERAQLVESLSAVKKFNFTNFIEPLGS